MGYLHGSARVVGGRSRLSCCKLCMPWALRLFIESAARPRAGLMYLRLPLDSSTAGYNRAAALWVAMFAFTLMPSETACTVWNQERAVARAPPH